MLHVEMLLSIPRRKSDTYTNMVEVKKYDSPEQDITITLLCTSNGIRRHNVVYVLYCTYNVHVYRYAACPLVLSLLALCGSWWDRK